MPRATRKRRIQPLVAWHATKELIRDPERTDLVFTIIRALSGDAFEKLFQRVAADPVGRATLDEGRSLLATLSDLPSLRVLPEGTLGRCYARFMDEENLSADGLVAASEQDEQDDAQVIDPRARRFGERLRDMHDLWHVSAGYGRDLLGEDALLAFSYAQTRNRGIAFIVLMASIELWRAGQKDALRTVWHGYRRGRRAQSLAAADWEGLLDRPLSEVRQHLGLGEPPSYQPMFKDPPLPLTATG